MQFDFGPGEANFLDLEHRRSIELRRTCQDWRRASETRDLNRLLEQAILAHRFHTADAQVPDRFNCETMRTDLESIVLFLKFGSGYLIIASLVVSDSQSRSTSGLEGLNHVFSRCISCLKEVAGFEAANGPVFLLNLLSCVDYLTSFWLRFGFRDRRRFSSHSDSDSASDLNRKDCSLTGEKITTYFHDAVDFQGCGLLEDVGNGFVEKSKSGSSLRGHYGRVLSARQSLLLYASSVTFPAQSIAVSVVFSHSCLCVVCV